MLPLYNIWHLLHWSLASIVVSMYMEPHATIMSRTAELCIPLHAAAAQDVLMYVDASIWSGSGLMSTSKRSCTRPGQPQSECGRRYRTPAWAECRIRHASPWQQVCSELYSGRGLEAHTCTLLRTALSVSEATNVMARPLVPKRPARPTCKARCTAVNQQIDASHAATRPSECTCVLESTLTCRARWQR